MLVIRSMPTVLSVSFKLTMFRKQKIYPVTPHANELAFAGVEFGLFHCTQKGTKVGKINRGGEGGGKSCHLHAKHSETSNKDKIVTQCHRRVPGLALSESSESICRKA